MGFKMDIDQSVGRLAPILSNDSAANLPESAAPQQPALPKNAFVLLMDNPPTPEAAPQAPVLPLQRAPVEALIEPAQAKEPESGQEEAPLPEAAPTPLVQASLAPVTGAPVIIAEYAPSPTSKAPAAPLPQQPLQPMAAAPVRAFGSAAAPVSPDPAPLPAPLRASVLALAKSEPPAAPPPEIKTSDVAVPALPAPGIAPAAKAEIPASIPPAPTLSQTPVPVLAAAPPSPTFVVPALAAQSASQPQIQQIDTEPDFTLDIKIERQSLEIASKFNMPYRAPPPIGAQISSQIQLQIGKAEKQTIELRLDPPELGRVTVQLTTQDQVVTAQITADRADTVELMRRHAELLNATLEKAGFSQANLSFQQGSPQDNQSTADEFDGPPVYAESPEPTLLSTLLVGQNGRLDIRL